MATNYERRITKMEESLKNTKDDVKEIKGDVKAILNKFDDLDTRYPTRREFAAANWVFGIVLSLIGLFVAVTK